jgi:hypothetical protein
LPYELAYIWKWFQRLSWKRESGMGVNPLTSAEILAWQRRHRLQFEPFEESIIDRLDALYLSKQNKPRS